MSPRRAKEFLANRIAKDTPRPDLQRGDILSGIEAEYIKALQEFFGEPTPKNRIKVTKLAEKRQKLENAEDYDDD